MNTLPSNQAAAPSPFVNLQMESEFIRACLQKPGFAQRLLSRVPEDIFTNEVHSWIVGQLKFLINQNRGKLPRVPVEVLKHMTSSIEDEDKRRIFLQTVDTLYKKPVEYEEYAEKTIRDYASYQALTVGIREAMSQYRRHNDVSRAIATLEESTRKSRAVLSDANVYDYIGNWKEREQARQFTAELGNKVIIKMGIPKIDEQVKLMPGTVTGFLAPFKRYKSIVLNHIAVAGVMQGYNVIKVTLENTVELESDRFDAKFAGIDMNKMMREAPRSKTDEEQVERVFNRVSNWPQKLKIMAMPAKKTTIAEVEAEIDHLEMNEGFSPELIVLDYGNIFAPSTKRKDEKDNFDQEQIVWDMQALAKHGRSKRVVVTAFQSKVEGVKAERLTADQMGRSIGISQALDCSIAIDQNEHEKSLGIVTLSPLFIRYGGIIHPEVTLDSAFSKMSIDRQSDQLLWQEVMDWES